MKEEASTWGRTCVWMCEACERVPAAFICKADAASLCATCDADIHSANPLARRHHRVPISPESLPRRPGEDFHNNNDDEDDDDDQDDETASWLLLPNPKIPANANGNAFFGGAEVEEYLDLVEYNNTVDEFGGGGNKDSVVPCGDHFGVKGNGNMMTMTMMMNQQQQQQQGFEQMGMGLGLDLELEFDHQSPKPGAYASYGASISHSVSVSSMDMSVVPDSAGINDMTMSQSQARPAKGTIDLFSGPPIQVATQLSPMDREARVLRYREKKKTRKFEKTIRYASRKAYAETRPRIKGRFAKRTDVEVEVDQMFSAALMASDTGYGIVPSF